MKPQEIRNMTLDEMKIKLEELEESLSNLYIQKATKQLNNPKQILQDRKDIARIKTIMREQEIQKEKGKVKKE